MTRKRGVVAVACMARPRRSGVERALVDEAFAAMPHTLSRRGKALALARKVAGELVADRSDPVSRALIRAREAVGGDPVFRLATDPEISLHGLLEELRLERFTARGCAWVDRETWQRETEQIEAELVERLAARFRRK